MIRLSIPMQVLRQARLKAARLGSLPNSITNGAGNLFGFVGEILVAQFYDGTIQSTFSHDMIIAGRTAEVKTLHCTSAPAMHYDCSVCSTSTHQKSDDLYFVRVMQDFSAAWLCGYLARETFFAFATEVKAGDEGEGRPNRWKYKAAGFHLSIADVQRLGGLYGWDIL